MEEKIQKAAQEYAEKKLPELLLTIEKEPWPKTLEILAKAYSDGYTATEQSMWRSVEDEEPPIGKLILCRDSNDAALVYYDGEDMYEPAYPSCNIRMPFWMPIPELPLRPETNTKKK